MRWQFSAETLFSFSRIIRFTASPREKAPGSTRVLGHAFLAWHSSWRTVVYIYYITASWKSISSQLDSSCQGNRYGTEKAGSTARPSHTKSQMRVTPSATQVGRRAVLGSPLAFGLIGHYGQPQHTPPPNSNVRRLINSVILIYLISFWDDYHLQRPLTSSMVPSYT